MGVSAVAWSGGGRAGVEEVERLGGRSRVPHFSRQATDEGIEVANLMTAPPPIIPAHLTMAAARKVAALKSATTLLVEAEGRLVGVVEPQALARATDADRVSSRMSPLRVCLRPGTTAARAREIFAQQQAGCLPVAAGLFVVGVVSRRQIERACLGADGDAPALRAAA
jgi:CBS domain-containing protein